MFANANAYLLSQVETRAAKIALRFKERGVWEQRTWGEVLHEVKHQAWLLRKQGIEIGHRVLLDPELKPQTLYQFLAVHWIGGTVVLSRQEQATDAKSLPIPLDDDDPREAWNQPPVDLNPDHPLVEVRDQNLGQNILNFGEWVRRADQLVIQTQLHDRDDVFAGPFWEIIPAWFMSGSRFHIPELPETLEVDRSEIAPTFILESADYYASWLKSIQSRLSQSGVQGPGSWLARRRLRRILGLQRIRVALIQDDGPNDSVRDFFASLNIFIDRIHEPNLRISSATGWSRSRWAQGLFEAQNEVMDQYKVIL